MRRISFQTHVVAAALGWLCLAGGASANDVTGSFIIPQELLVDSANAGCRNRACFWNEPNGVYPLRAQRISVPRQFAVALLGRTSKPEPLIVELSGGGFQPATAAASTGTTLKLINKDDFPRHPYAIEHQDAKIPLLPSEGSAEVKLLSTGVWHFKDKKVPHADSTVHVFSDLTAVGRLQEDGSFVFTDVRRGDYRLVLLYGAQQLASQKISVPGGSKRMKLDAIKVSAQPAGGGK